MRIISRKPIVEAIIRYPQIEASLESWYYFVKHAQWNNLSELKKDFPSADYVKNDRYIFNIKGNQFRLIVKIIFAYKVVYVRFIGTHKEYDSINAGEI